MGFKEVMKKIGKEITAEEMLLSDEFKQLIQRFLNVSTGGKIKFMIFGKNPMNKTACTDNKRIMIYIPNIYYAVANSSMEKFMAVLALLAHELGHCFYTDFKKVNLWREALSKDTWYPQIPDNLPEGIELTNPSIKRYVIKHGFEIINILEDGYVERKMMEKYPGLFREALNYLQRKSRQELLTQEQIDEIIEKAGITAVAKHLVFNYSYYGEFDLADSNDKIDELCQKLEPLLKRYDKSSVKKKLEIANEITAIVLGYEKDHFESEEPEDGEAGSESEGDESDGESSGSTDDGTGESKDDEAGSESEGDESDGESSASTDDGTGESRDGESEDAGSGKPKNGDYDSFGDYLDDMLSDEEEGYAPSSEMPDRKSRLIPSSEERDSEWNLDELFLELKTEIMERIAADEIEKDALSEMEEYNDKDVQYIKPPNYLQSDDYNKEDLINLSKEGKRAARKISDQIKVETQTKTKKGQYTGRLNKSGLHRRDLKVFNKKGNPNQEIDMSCVILIDRSGSTKRGNLFYDLSKGAVYLSAVFEELKIPTMVVGYTSDTRDYHKNSLEVYQTFEAPCKCARKRIISGCAQEQNRDGMFFRSVTKVMNSRTETTKIIIILSDGEPTDGRKYCGGFAKADTLEAIKEMKRNNIQPIIAGIGSCAKQLQILYGNENYLDVTDPTQLSTKLMRVMKKIIRSNIGRG